LRERREKVNIKNIEQLKREKLRLHYEMELAELELKGSFDSLSNRTKPSQLIESVLDGLPIKNLGVFATMASFAFKLFTKKK